MPIASVAARRVVVPLERPVRVGDAVVTQRDYVVVEVATSDGAVGRAIANGRGSPVDGVVSEVVGPLVVGLDPLRTEQVWARMYYGCLPIGQRGPVMTAISLIDICCWDIKAQLAGMPLATLLGGARQQVDIAIAGAYPELTPDPAAVRDEVERHVAAGYRAIKLGSHGAPTDTARLEAARDACGDNIELMVDVHWGWRDLPTAVRTARHWTAFDLLWIEDPFPARHVDLLRPFRRAVDVPLAVGEDRAGVDDFVPLIGRDEVDYIRIDATVCGGITEFLRVAALAATRGRLLSPHVFPELHVHLAAGVPNVLGVETVGADSPVSPIYRLLEPLEVRAGVVTPPEQPGIGLVFDDDALARYAVS